MVTVVARIKANIRLSDYVSSSELARIMDKEEVEARDFISGELSFEWEEFTQLIEFLELDKSKISFTVAEDAQVSILI